jgi:hypothetical protein
MRLIASYKFSEGLEYDINKALLEDINKIPTFQTVRLPPLYSNVNERRLIIDSENNVVALVSDKYKLSQPKTIARQLITALPLPVYSYEIWYYNGRIWLKILFQVEQTSNAGNYKAGILYEDSVDKSLLLKIIYSPRLSACGNELIFSKCRMSTRHVSTLFTNVENFMKHLVEFVKNPAYINKAYERMSKETVTLERYTDIMNKLYLPKKYTEKVRWVNGMSLWDLYMKLTNILTVSKAPLQYHLQVAKLVEI